MHRRGALSLSPPVTNARVGSVKPEPPAGRAIVERDHELRAIALQEQVEGLGRHPGVEQENRAAGIHGGEIARHGGNRVPAKQEHEASARASHARRQLLHQVAQLSAAPPPRGVRVVKDLARRMEFSGLWKNHGSTLAPATLYPIHPRIGRPGFHGRGTVVRIPRSGATPRTVADAAQQDLLKAPPNLSERPPASPRRKRPAEREEAASDGAEGGVVVESSLGSAFEAVEADFLFEPLVVALDAPVEFGEPDERSQAGVLRERCQPELSRLGLAVRQFDEQPQGFGWRASTTPPVDSSAGVTQIAAKRDDCFPREPSRQRTKLKASPPKAGGDRRDPLWFQIADGVRPGSSRYSWLLRGNDRPDAGWPDAMVSWTATK